MHRPAPSIIFVFITLLLDVLGIGLIIPVAPRLVQKVMGLAGEGAENRAAIAVGTLAATYAAMQFIFAPILGSLSDRFGRRPVILISLFGSGVDYIVAAFAPNLIVLFITRALNGLSGANISACSAYIADITPPEKRAAGFGMIGAAFGLGFVFGPLMGGVLGDPAISLPVIGPGDVHHPFLAAGLLTMLNWVYGCFVLPESLPQHLRRPFSWAKANPIASLAWLGTHRVVIHVASALFLLNIAQFALHATWVLSMGLRFGWGSLKVGVSLFIVGITSAIVQGGLTRVIVPRLGERACLVGGIGVAVLAFAGYGLATQGWMIYAIIAAASIGGLAGPAAQGIVTKAIPPTEQGRLQGSLASLQCVANVIGPLAGAGVFRFFTSESAPNFVPGAPFLMGSLLSACALIPLARIWKGMPTSVAQAPVEDAK